MIDIRTFEKYAIFQTGGKQYQAIEQQTIAVEKLAGAPGDIVEFKDVLFKKSSEGKFEVGKPFIGSSIKALVIKQTLGPKSISFTFKRRKKVRVKKGHRQPLTVLRILSL